MYIINIAILAVGLVVSITPVTSLDPVVEPPTVASVEQPPTTAPPQSPAMYHGIEEYSDFYNLPPLPFKFGSMEPQFDAPTMKIHYIEVHANFTKTMNRLLKEWRKEVHVYLFWKTYYV